MSRLKSMKRLGGVLSSMAVCSFGIIIASASSPAGASGYQSQHAGGTLHLDATAAGGTLDPQNNYTLQYWQLYQATYDGLVSFQKVGGKASFDVVPDLATAMPTGARPTRSPCARASSSPTARPSRSPTSSRRSSDCLRSRTPTPDRGTTT